MLERMEQERRSPLPVSCHKSVSVYRFMFCLLVLVFCCARPVRAGAEPATPETPATENYVYDISFLWFDRLAEARLSLAPGEQSGTLQGRLEAKTLGAAAWLTSDREQRYGALMESDGQGRLRSLRYDADILKTKDGKRKSRLKRYLFDHDRQQIILQVNRNGRVRPEEVLPMPVSAPNDILTAFYNFRRGVFGEVRAGGHYRIPTMGRGEASEIVVDLYDEAHRPKKRKFPPGGLLARVKVDPEVFDTGEGILYIWFDAERRPALVVVEDVIGMGDVRCTLRTGEKKP
jgi:hypothetical protein